LETQTQLTPLSLEKNKVHMLKKATLFLLLLVSSICTAQNSVIKGIIKNTNKEPIEGVSISYLNYGTTSNNMGNIPLLYLEMLRLKLFLGIFRMLHTLKL